MVKIEERSAGMAQTLDLDLELGWILDCYRHQR